MTSRFRHRAPAAFTLLAFVMTVAFGSSARAAEGALPDALRTELEAVMKAKVAKLFDEKDKDGLSVSRGTYSTNFLKVDDATYQVTYHKDTIQTAVATRDQLKVERYLATLKKSASGKWEIASEDLKESFDGLYRSRLMAAKFHKFDALSFEKEGLKVSSGPGYLVRYYLKGEPSGFTLMSDDLKYTYAPPVNMGFYGAAVSHYAAVHNQLIKKNPEDLNFTPERLWAQCDAKTCAELFTTAFKGVVEVDPATASGGVFAKLKSEYEKNLQEARANERDNAFRGFDKLDEPDNRYWRMSLKKSSAKEHWFWVSCDNFDAREVAVGATGYFGPLFSYNSEETRAKNIDPYELEKRIDEEARDYDLKGINGSVDISISGEAVLDGDILYTMNIKRDLKMMPFYISRVRFGGDDNKETKNPKLFVNSIQDGRGNELTWVKLGAITGLIIFPETVKAGTNLELRMQFKNLDSVYQLNPSYAAMDRGGWLPFVRFADMIDSFDLTVRTPGKYKVLGIGKNVTDTVKDGIRTTKWTSPFKVSFPTIIFGEYITDTSDYKATKIDKTEIPVNVYVDKVSIQAVNFENVGSEVGARDSIAASQAGARDIRGKQLKAIATQAAVALDLYKKLYGVDYPFAKLDLVADPMGAFYGQAPASIIYLGFGVFRGEGALIADENLSKFNKDVVAHETGHQWWGSLICNANDRNYWFVETLAELSSAIYVEEVFGRKRYLQKVADWRQNVLDASPVSNVQDGYTVWGGGGFGSAQANIYNKGPYAFHILRETFGDEKFKEFLKELATSLVGKEIVTRDIQQVAERVYGGTMEWFFDQWIRGIGTPQYAFYYTKKQTEDGKWLIEGKIRQRVVYGPDKVEMAGVYYRAVAPVTFVYHDGKTSKSKPILIQGAETPFRMKVPDEPAEVKFNADGEIFAHDVLVNRSW